MASEEIERYLEKNLYYLEPEEYKKLREKYGEPMDFDALTKIKGDPKRHIEQLWDEVKTLKHKVQLLEAENKVFRKLLENVKLKGLDQ